MRSCISHTMVRTPSRQSTHQKSGNAAVRPQIAMLRNAAFRRLGLPFEPSICRPVTIAKTFLPSRAGGVQFESPPARSSLILRMILPRKSATLGDHALTSSAHEGFMISAFAKTGVGLAAVPICAISRPSDRPRAERTHILLHVRQRKKLRGAYLCDLFTAPEFWSFADPRGCLPAAPRCYFLLWEGGAADGANTDATRHLQPRHARHRLPRFLQSATRSDLLVD